MSIIQKTHDILDHCSKSHFPFAKDFYDISLMDNIPHIDSNDDTKCIELESLYYTNYNDHYNDIAHDPSYDYTLRDVHSHLEDFNNNIFNTNKFSVINIIRLVIILFIIILTYKYINNVRN